MRCPILSVFVAAMTLTLCGCWESSGSIRGIVMINGQPAKLMMVTFKSQSENSEGLGMTDEAGRFVLYHGRGKDTFRPGEYRVAVQPMSIEGDESKKVKLPSTVTNIEMTTLSKTVQPGANHIEIDLIAEK